MTVKKKLAMTEEQLLHVAMIVYTLYVLYLIVTKNFVPRFITPYGLYLFVLVEEKLEKFCKKLYHNLMNR
ncbi:TPA: hypothetical protein U2D16_000316 [Streptococcus suis]|nr:hypothetical protein [Streptococcus suis]HEM6007546.1 hypothetical protein [Streptococcus suis]HEM6014004.1 hypothetical protein [Streptococcus suis]HEM6029274.1 hypothetical protein [Streptococcus suis]HEM6213193.1 hypothetical protein [Streptococcus suis]